MSGVKIALRIAWYSNAAFFLEAYCNVVSGL